MTLARLVKFRQAAFVRAMDGEGLEAFVAGCAWLAADGWPIPAIAGVYGVCEGVAQAVVGLWILEAAKAEIAA